MEVTFWIENTRLYPELTTLSECTLDIAQEGDEMFLREKLEQDITFINNPGKNIFDYDVLKAYEVNQPFVKLSFFIKDESNNVVWQGETIPIDWDIDDDFKEIKFKPEPIDEYSEILKNKDVEVNVLNDVGTYDINGKYVANLDFTITVSSNSDPVDLPAGLGWAIYAIISGIQSSSTSSFSSPRNEVWHIFSRQRLQVPKNTTGVPGTYIKDDDLSDDNIDVYFRSYAYSNPLPDISLFEFSNNYTETNYQLIINKASSILYYKKDGQLFKYIHIFNTAYKENQYEQNVNLNAEYVGRKLKDVIEYLVNQTQSKTLTLVANNISNLDNLYLIDKSDFKYPNNTRSGQSTINKIKFSDLMKDIWVLFNQRWKISGNNFVIDYEINNNEVGYDLTTLNSGKYLNKSSYYKYDKAIILNRQNYHIRESGSLDWQAINAHFDTTPLESGEKLESRETQLLNTDVDYINQYINNQSSIGFVLVEVENGNIKQNTGIITGRNYQNANLSTIALYYDYHNKFKPVNSYYIKTTISNKINLTSESLNKIKVQEGLQVISTDDVKTLTDKYTKNVRTLLGNGKVKRVKRDLYSDSYRFDTTY